MQTDTDTMTASAPGIDRLVRLEHHDPHAVLGAHPDDVGLVVRALEPDARTVAILIDAGRVAIPAVRVHEGGVFEAFIARRSSGPLRYRVEARFADGTVIERDDPYRFLPTVSDDDLHYLGEGTHARPWDVLGAHVRVVDGVAGVAFCVWAPNARGASVVGDWNGWDGRRHPMRSLGGSGLWELFIPGVVPGSRYKLEIRPAGDGPPALKADPWARESEHPPATASVIAAPSAHRWDDAPWLEERARVPFDRAAVSIYEVHLPSWRRHDDGTPLSFREVAEPLADHVESLGFTHVELLPVMEHPFGGSWGYQVGSYFAPTARLGGPDDLRFLIDHLHGRGIGVILDWVPAHFPKDAHALGRFDGTPLYEHGDPREGEHPDWGTYIFNYGREEVATFLEASALFWIEELHVDGLRVDAVASMLYRDYSRDSGDWVPNQHGGRENLEAIAFVERVNARIRARHPDVMVIAEESTAFPGVSTPVEHGGLGFDAKWNMGWMHDVLVYFGKEPVHRKHHHHELTFSFHYAWSERFVLPISHDEVVHGKGSLLSKMPGDRWQQLANLRALLALQWAHPGKKLLFMGCEHAEEREWSHEIGLDWALADRPDHAGVARLVADLNRLYRREPALHAACHDPAGTGFIDGANVDQNVLAFLRIDPASGRQVAVIANLSPVVRRDHRLGLPRGGLWREVLNTDATCYGGEGVGNEGGVSAEAVASHGHPFSATFTLPPLAAIWFDAPNP